MSMNDVLSVQHPRNTPRTVISIRFRDVELADEFMDRIRANPPASMARLHAVKPAVYEKRATANNE
jgi:hypothetical protein